nr:EAL domain-containing protein [Aestuariicella hydrocarbonica]
MGVSFDGALYYVSPSVEELLGYSSQVFLRLYNQSLAYQEMSCEDDQRFAALQAYLRRQALAVTSRAGREGMGEPETLQVNHRDGFHLYVSAQCLPAHAVDGGIEGVVCICHDLSTRKHSSDAMALAFKVFENSLTAIYITNGQGLIVQANKAFVRLTGYSLEEVIGESPKLMDVDRYSKAYFQAISDHLERKDYWEGEIHHRRKDGQVFPAWAAISVLRDANQNVTNTISYFADVTERRHSDTQIHQLAYFDALTGLPNRSLFADRVLQAARRAKRSDQWLAVLLLDVIRLTHINDIYGHSVGDALLCEFSRRLQDCVRNEDTVARTGGDELGLLLSGMSDRAQTVTIAAQIAEKICHHLAQPVVIGRHRVLAGVCVGIALYPADGSETHTLLHHAEIALQGARQAGKHHYRFYNEAMTVSVKARLASENALFQALRLEQFEIYYQPLLSTQDGTVTAVEALLRWNHPDKGVLLPIEFLSVAQASGLIRPIGDWVLKRVCEQWWCWRHQGVSVGRVAVNVAPEQFAKGHLLSELRSVLRQTRIPAGTLELELSEEALNLYPSDMPGWLEEMRRMGVSLCLDHFGAGYSSMQELKSLPLDRLKVDRRFIGAWPAVEDRRAVRAMVALAKSLELNIAVEGIETRAQLEFVQQLGCDEVQGYFLGRPERSQHLPWV